MKARTVDIGLLFIRIGLGGLMIIYGSQKMFGLFGGEGYAHQVAGFQKMGFPPLAGSLAIFAEFFGALGVLVGGLTRVAAFGLFVTMAVATWVNLKAPDAIHNFFTSGNPGDVSKIGFPFVLMLTALGLIFTGGGAYSLDAKLPTRRKGK